MECDNMQISQITVEELKRMQTEQESFTLIDVREIDEWNYCHIEKSEFMPLSEINAWVDTLDPDTHYVFMCHHGVRSMQAAMIAHSRGVERVANLAGGIDAWSRRIDSSIPCY